ncbi:hypothetical protein DA075_02370 [Methylobacterium currus]|uniref:Uncharacterized protein n=1 Tax=Methylobacterium currus TaxID=2051553 RepID=A0A2R4WEH5_9HYPH|nr:hypothetical protein [Methylobacterium currus]AWB19919.1 hypothetical protein DA075_02370 [Methylobacterium currus]UHC15361.1 hypothetical protein LRS73_23020 [Methylobacterium currus]
MRFLLAPALLVAACCSSLAAAPSPFRAALAAAGGCGAHRALAEDRLGRLSAATAAAVPQGEADLFGKPAGEWTEDEIRDALSAFAACEIRSGPAGTGRSERLARDLRGLDTALRRAIVVAHARAPVEAGAERAPHGSGRGGAPTGSVRLRQGPAFAPSLRSGGGAMEVLRPGAASGDTPPADAPHALAVPAALPDAWDDAPTVRTWRTQPPAADPALAAPPRSALAPVAAHRPPTQRTQCPVSLGAFDLLQAEMRLSEVEDLLGCRGTIDATAMIPGLGTFETYLWSDRGSGATVTLVFQNKRLRSKAQRGLGAEAGRGG